MNEMTQRGIAALKAGNRMAARQILGEAVRQDPSNVLGWLWLSGAVESDDERVAILRHVLHLDPANQTAQRGLNQILKRRVRQSEEVSESAPAEISKPEPVGTGEEQAPVNTPTTESHADEAGLPVAQAASVVQNTTTTESLPEADQSLQSAQAAPAQKSARQPRKKIDDGYEHRIFRTRPSLVQTLAAFWIFFFGAVALGAVLFSIPDMATEMAFFATLATGLVLELVVLFVAIRQLRTHYELTSQHLSLPFRGQRVQVPASDIYSAESRQSPIQKLLSTGDIWINAAVAGELAQLRLRDVPECHKRAEQILSLVHTQQG